MGTQGWLCPLPFCQDNICGSSFRKMNLQVPDVCTSKSPLLSCKPTSKIQQVYLSLPNRHLPCLMVRSASAGGRRPGADPVVRDRQKKGGVSVDKGSGRGDSVLHSQEKLGGGAGPQGPRRYWFPDGGKRQGGKSCDRWETEA